jgi:hypothetical protein
MQRHLFPLPKAIQYKLTPMQWRVIDWVAFNEGGHAVFPLTLSKPALRRLIQKRLVEVIGHSPARYMLSALGRAVRASHGVRQPLMMRLAEE